MHENAPWESLNVYNRDTGTLFSKLAHVFKTGKIFVFAQTSTLLKSGSVCAGIL
jgi:hypothetical protein